jgi:hypothetical protein
LPADSVEAGGNAAVILGEGFDVSRPLQAATMPGSTRMWRAAPAAALVTLVLLGGACAPTEGGQAGAGLRTGASPTSSSDQSDELRAAIASGSVDHDDYVQGFLRYSSCLRESGHEIVRLGEKGPLLDYAIPESAVSSGDDERCYRQEFERVDDMWQLANEDASAWAETLRACLRDRGVEPEGSVPEMEQRLVDSGSDAVTCFSLTG